jgi:hypothetical protein
MDFLMDAIKTKAEADFTLMALISDFEPYQVPEGTEFPYVIYFIVPPAKDAYEFSANGMDITVQFSIYSDKYFDTEISSIFYALDKCFHRQEITYTDGYRHKSCLNQGMTGPERVEDGVLMITADYEFKIRGVT